MIAPYRRFNRPNNNNWSCVLCNEHHRIEDCQKFLKLRPSERLEAVRQYSYCINCLSKCCKGPRCDYCDKRHHSLLHDASELSGALEQPNGASYDQTIIRRNGQPSTSKAAASKVVALTKIDHPKVFSWAKVFIPTVMLRVFNTSKEQWCNIRAVITKLPYSRIALATQQLLDLKVIDYKKEKFAKFRIAATSSDIKWSAVIHAKVTTALPSQPYDKPINEDPTKNFTKDSLADPDPRNNTPYDLELGADVFHLINRNGSLKTNLRHVIAESTVFGYTFTGPVSDLFNDQ